MGAKDLAEVISAKHGLAWNEDTISGLLGEYIDNQNDEPAIEDFLEKKAQEEIEATKDPEENEFKVFVISLNANSFGLHQVIMMNRKGRTLKALKTGQFLPKKGDVLILGEIDVLLSLSRLMYEVPEEVEGLAPPVVIAAVWET